MSFLIDRLDKFSDLIHKTCFSDVKGKLSFQQALEEVHKLFADSIHKKKKIFIIGNGGSSGIASHHMVDLINVVKASAFVLSDSNLTSCISNDYGYPFVFSNPLETLAQEGDILIAISSSGNSENIINACKTMQEKNGQVVTLSGFNQNNPMRLLGDINIWTGVCDYGLVESAHFFILHTFVDSWAQKIKSSQVHLSEIGI